MNDADATWPGAVVSFISGNIPRGVAGWDHRFMTAYQFGCNALAALGQATEVNGGAAPREAPEFPDRLPRWDDICVVVLSLVNQQRRLSWRMPDGSRPPRRTVLSQVLNAPPPPASNILPAHGLGSAYVDDEVAAVLAVLGLINSDRRWTDRAELVLWREQPEAWDMRVPADHRFLAAVQAAVDDMPDDIRYEVDQLVAISDRDVEELVQSHVRTAAELEARFGCKSRDDFSMTPERALNALRFWRRGSLDRVFFRRWRLPDGWLTPDEATRALEIFHDPLAIQMRRAVLSRLYPHLPYLSER